MANSDIDSEWTDMWIIDRFEGDYAVVECGEVRFNIPRCALPDGAGEGDVIALSLDHRKTDERSEHINSLMNKLFGDER